MNPLSRPAEDTSDAARRRLQIAHEVAADLVPIWATTEVWLEGALAQGLAHHRSDIDLRVVTTRPPDEPIGSVIRHGVRIDLNTTTPEQVRQVRELLAAFTVDQQDLHTFRRVRAAMNELTRYRTALRWTATGWQPVSSPAEADTYRRWALAHQIERAHSLAEDLIGLLDADLLDEAAITWHDLDLTTALATCAAHDAPLLASKWTPSLTRRFLTAALDPIGRPTTRAEYQHAFRSVQGRTSRALMRCWPLPTPPAHAPAAVGHDTTSAGWLLQRYSNQWLVGCGDDRRPLAEDDVQAWAHIIGGTP